MIGAGAVPLPAEAAIAEEAIVAWETLRLDTYRSRPGNPDRIEWRRFGRAWVGRFPTVGYFNQVLGLTVEDLPLMGEIESFLADAPAPPKWYVAPDTDRAACFTHLHKAGYRPVSATVRVARVIDPDMIVAVAPPPGAEVVPLSPETAADFAPLYLEVFGAVPVDREGAITNLSLLPSQPGVHGMLVRMDGEYVGLGVVHVRNGVTFFCAGGVREGWRERGLQTWLIRERLRLAARHGTRLAVSWADRGGVSLRNLIRGGFREVSHQEGWARPRGSHVS